MPALPAERWAAATRPNRDALDLDLVAHGHALAQVLLGEHPDGSDGHGRQQRADRWLAERVAQHDGLLDDRVGVVLAAVIDGHPNLRARAASGSWTAWHP